MIRQVFFIFGVMVISLMTDAASITVPIFTEERTLKLAHDIVVGDIVDVVEIGDKKNNCLTGMAKLKVSHSFYGNFKDDNLVELGFTHSTILPNIGDKYLAVINTRSKNFYSDCINPKFKKYENRFTSENIFLVYRANFGKLFEGDDGQQFEFNSCQKNIDFLYQSKVRTSKLSAWETKDGKTCKKMVGDYGELRDLILADLLKEKNID